MFNLIEAANQLKQLPDEQLPQLMQGGDPSVPQYLVMSEIQRRKEMRQSPMMTPSKADRTTVMDNMQQEVMQQGLPSLPQSVDQSPAAPEAANAGIVQMAGGGYVSDRMQELREALADIKGRASGVQDYMRERGNDMREFTAPVRNYMGQRLNEMDQFVGDSQRKVMANEQFADQQRAQAAQEHRANKAIADSIHRPASATPPYVPEEAGMPARIGGGGGGGGIGGGMGGMPAVPDMARPEMPVVPQEAAGQGGLAALLAQREAIDKPDLKNYEDFLPEIEKNMPDEYGEIMKRLESKKGSVAQRRKDAVNLALMSAGMGMLSSKSPHAMVGIGEGGMAGLATLQKGLGEANQYEDNIDEQMIRAQQGRARDKGERYKMAAGMAKDENASTMGIYREDKKDQRDDTRWLATETLNDQRAKYNMDREDARAKYAMDREEYKQRNQNARSSASIAARSKSGGKGGAKSSASERQIEAVMREKGVGYTEAIEIISKAKRAPSKADQRGSAGGYKMSDFKVER